MTETITAAITAYILGILLCSSRIMSMPRSMFRSLFGAIPGIGHMLTMSYEGAIITEDEEIAFAKERDFANGYDFISCRLCTGFYISAVVSYDANLSLSSFLAVYGLSYFMAKLEQP